jgi:hypothetical protein
MTLNGLPSYIIDNLTEKTAIDTYNWIYRKDESIITIDLINPRNHRAFLQNVNNISRDIPKNKVFPKNIVIGYLKKNFTKGKDTHFQYNRDFDVISILVKYNILKDIGNDKFRLI